MCRSSLPRTPRHSREGGNPCPLTRRRHEKMIRRNWVNTGLVQHTYSACYYIDMPPLLPHMPEPDLEALLRWASPYVTDQQLIEIARLDYEPVEGRVEQILPGLQKIRDARSLFQVLNMNPGERWDCAFRMYTYCDPGGGSMNDIAGVLFAGGVHFIQNTFDSGKYYIQTDFLLRMMRYIIAAKNKDAAVAGAQTLLASCEWTQTHELILDRSPSSYYGLLIYQAMKPYLTTTELCDCREELLKRIEVNHDEYIQNIKLCTATSKRFFRKNKNLIGNSDYKIISLWAKTETFLKGSSFNIQPLIDDVFSPS
jgi:hypothetical protein